MAGIAVVPLAKSVCDAFVSAKHYTRRPSVFWKGFGLVENGMVVGVAVYGQPSPPIQKHAFRDRDFRLYELCRVVVQTKTKNAASLLVGRSLNMLEKPCAVVSYADMEQGHSGIIYQATNWLYTGATVSHDKLYVVEGKRTHPMTLRDMGITNPTAWARENNIPYVKPSPKHRYFYLVGNKWQKRNMLSKLKYDVINDYPKTEKTYYDDGAEMYVRYEEAMNG